MIQKIMVNNESVIYKQYTSHYVPVTNSTHMDLGMASHHQSSGRVFYVNSDKMCYLPGVCYRFPAVHGIIDW